MNYTILKQVRQQLYASFERGADALFNLGDALLCESQAQSLPELSLSPFFERQWPSVYEALEDGRINVEQLRAIWVNIFLPSGQIRLPSGLRSMWSNLARPALEPAQIGQSFICQICRWLTSRSVSVGPFRPWC